MDHMKRIEVALGDRGYDVCIAPSLRGLGEEASRLVRVGRCVVLTDDTVGPLWGPALERELRAVGFEPDVLEMKAGEAEKTKEAWWGFVDGLLGLRVDRKTPIFVLGGGVVGDVGGFAASCVLRGLPWIQVPTTVLAMVDSSVGGKTGFNHPSGKNLIGAFSQPRLVWAALETLETLDPRERVAGLGEVVKAGLIADQALFEQVERDAERLVQGETEAMAEAIAGSVVVKAKVVAEDEREAGRRMILNAGHTVGHGVETAMGYGVILHGEAVALGLLQELLWARTRGLTKKGGLTERLRRLLRVLGLPTDLPVGRDAEVIEAMKVDKKVAGAILNVPIPDELGSCVIHAVPLSEIASFLTDNS